MFQVKMEFPRSFLRNLIQRLLFLIYSLKYIYSPKIHLSTYGISFMLIVILPSCIHQIISSLGLEHYLIFVPDPQASISTLPYFSHQIQTFSKLSGMALKAFHNLSPTYFSVLNSITALCCSAPKYRHIVCVTVKLFYFH